MIRLDDHNIIVQHNPYLPAYADGGDSCNRNGLMAMTGDRFFINTIPLFVVQGNKVCRHPFQTEWADPSRMSRDQITCFAAGVKAWMDSPAQPNSFLATDSLVSAMKNYASCWFINKDFLLPNVRLALYKAAYIKAPLHIILMGYPWQVISLLWASWIRPNEEQNQTIAVCSIYGRGWVKLLRILHPYISGNLKTYWAGYPFRDQHEIYEVLEEYVDKCAR